MSVTPFRALEGTGRKVDLAPGGLEPRSAEAEGSPTGASDRLDGSISETRRPGPFDRFSMGLDFGSPGPLGPLRLANDAFDAIAHDTNFHA